MNQLQVQGNGLGEAAPAEFCGTQGLVEDHEFTLLLNAPF
jgi:hypothetical protein